MTSYFDVDAILAEEERIPCTFRVDGFRVGYLDPSDEDQVRAGLWRAAPGSALTTGISHDVKAGTELELCLSGPTREAMRADPTVVRLRDRSPYFYAVGLALAHMGSPADAAQLPALLCASLALRGSLILDTAHNSLGEDVSDFVNSLTSLEQRLFFRGYRCAKALAGWRRRDTTILRMSALALDAGIGGEEAIAAANADVSLTGARAKAAGIKRQRSGMRV
ncbi:PSF3 [Symbiodinium sp. KB8]|nr:PSF3 [Symbiodinium sp. KB8]